jgi:superfamily II DNA or RNA helicase/5-methylcytosine-specific restriction endonuclease McrA
MSIEMLVKSKNAATVRIKQGKNERPLYPHQIEAIQELNKINKKESFSTLVVLPTGAGKTATASIWLLSAAINNSKKILWLAHRHLLLEQAADAFSFNAFSDLVINRQSFKYRIISGQHDKPIHVKNDDDVLVVSKDSIIRNLESLDDWIKGEDELFVVIDEAHHATARSYRRVLDYVKSKIANVKVIGLTATPFRTSKQEKGLLGEVFSDPKDLKGNGGMVYEISLKKLIEKGILSSPKFESCETEISVGDELGLDAIKSIERLDVIPEDIAECIAKNKDRNHFIAKTYVKDCEKYGQTLVFALNRIHALTLKTVFEAEGKDKGIKAGVIMSGTKTEFIGIDVSSEENQRQIEAYRNGEIQVLINVNILTEGVDLPKTQTVFLTRPTVSVVLMTQMIGRALRGEKAGGTKDAYIISFIDNWNDKIAWINPESIIDDNEGFLEKDYEYKKRLLRTISIELLAEFAKIANEAVDTSRLERIDFIKRVPLGMYVFTFIDENSMEHNHQILVYDNSKQRYLDLISALPAMFEEFGIDEEIIPQEMLDELLEQCEDTYFNGDMIPPYIRRDIEYLLKYFAQKESAPLFISLGDTQPLDLSVIAKKIVDEDMGIIKQKAYTDKLWEDEKSLLRVYFGHRYFFQRQLDTEIHKELGIFHVSDNIPNKIYEDRHLEDIPLYKWKEFAPKKYEQMKELVFSNAQKGDKYICAICGKTSFYKAIFQIDHIFPMSKGGKTNVDNLQLLCRTCNMRKSDKI